MLGESNNKAYPQTSLTSQQKVFRMKKFLIPLLVFTLSIHGCTKDEVKEEVIESPPDYDYFASYTIDGIEHTIIDNFQFEYMRDVFYYAVHYPFRLTGTIKGPTDPSQVIHEVFQLYFDLPINSSQQYDSVLVDKEINFYNENGNSHLPLVLIEVDRVGSEHWYLSDTSLSNVISIKEVNFLEKRITNRSINIGGNERTWEIYNVRGSFSAKFIDGHSPNDKPTHITGDFFMQMALY